MGDRLTLIKFVLSSLPIYSISVKILLVRVYNLLNSLLSIFLCGGTNERRKIHPVKWKSFSLPLDRGRLRVPNLGYMNVALLSK